jgi:flagellar L-ring protein precursor FlgH
MASFPAAGRARAGAARLKSGRLVSNPPLWKASSLRVRAAVAFACALAAGGCVNAPLAPTLGASQAFEPVYPVAPSPARQATGSIYNGRQSDLWFGRGRAFQVGDVITVLLSESTQAARQQSANVSREATNEGTPTGLSGKIGSLATALGGINLNATKIDSQGTGSADQRASLTGSISVTVVEVLANGNLLVRGEKQLGLAEGTEVIQVSGILRPEDVSRNNLVQSRRLANAQIAYRGTGDLANASRPGWGTRLLMNLWPF